MYLLFIGACSHCHCWKSMKGTGSIVRRSKGLVLYEFGPVKGFRQLCLPSSLWACFLLDPFNAISWSHLPLSWPPSPQSWRSCLCTQGAVVPKTFSPAALCTLIKLSTHHSSFPSQERSWQASSFPHCSIIGKGHTGKVSLTLSYASKLAFPPLQQSIWTSPLDTGTTEKKKNLSYLLKSGSCRCLLNTAKRDEAGSQAAAGITVCTKVYPISWCMDGQCSFWEAWHMVLVSKIPKRYFLFWMKGKF